MRPVADCAVEQTLPFLNRQVRAAVELQRLTGARSGEILRLRLKDIERLRTAWIYRPSMHKTAYRGHGRETHLGPKAQALLAGFLELEPEAFLFEPQTARTERHAALPRALWDKPRAGGPVIHAKTTRVDGDESLLLLRVCTTPVG